MKIHVFRSGGKPIAQGAGVPVRVTNLAMATPSSSTEALLVVTAGEARSIVCWPGECNVYLSPRARYELRMKPLNAESYRALKGLSNTGILLGSARCIRTLSERGLVTRSAVSDGDTTWKITDEGKKAIAGGRP